MIQLIPIGLIAYAIGSASITSGRNLYQPAFFCSNTRPRMCLGFAVKQLANRSPSRQCSTSNWQMRSVLLQKSYHTGAMFNLSIDETMEPAREVLHLFMPLQPQHLFRVGIIKKRVPDDLAPARRDHLLLLRVVAATVDYGHDTDADLL